MALVGQIDWHYWKLVKWLPREEVFLEVGMASYLGQTADSCGYVLERLNGTRLLEWYCAVVVLALLDVAWLHKLEV